MSQQTKILSVVIPTYNEEDIIGECLDRLVPQLEHIHEIVIVDNNSTDKTIDIVDTYVSRYPEIVMIREQQQGLVYARNAGLDAATGQAIARIDSDSLVPPTWAADIVEFLLADTAGDWAALCGRGEAYGLPYGEAVSELKDRVAIHPFGTRRDAAKARVKSVPVLYGSNMVLRAETWDAVRDKVSMRRDIMEDVDTGLCVREMGGKNAFLPHITVGVSPRRMETSIPSFARYMSFLPRTLLMHKQYGYAAGAIAVYLPWVTAVHSARLLVIRTYDKETRTYSLRNMLRRTTDRIMP